MCKGGMVSFVLLFAALCCTALGASVRPVIIGNIRVSILTDRIIRFEYSNNHNYEDRPSLSFPQRPQGATSYSYYRITRIGSVTTLKTSALEINVSTDTIEGGLSCANLNVTLLQKPSTVWCPDMGIISPANLNGSVMTTDCYASADRCVEVYMERMLPGLFSRDGYTIIDDTTTAVIENGWVASRTYEMSYQDWVFVEGVNYKQTLKEFVTVSGQVPLLPHRAYSVWWSRWWPYNSSSLVDVIDGFAANNLPLSMVVLDMDWHKTGTPTLGCGPSEPSVLSMCAYGYGGYMWNTTLFADPPATLTMLHARGLQVMTNQHDQCAVDHCQENYPAFAQSMGVDPASKTPISCQFTSKAYVDGLYKFVENDNQSALVDFFWEDYGVSGGPDGSSLGCEGDQHCMACLADLGLGRSPLGNNSAALWTAAVRVGAATSLGNRGMTLGIYGGLGHHRYGIVGSGDTQEAWITLAYEVYSSFVTANVLTAWTHDIGGFYGSTQEVTWPYRLNADDPVWLHDPVRFLRWVQFGVFSSFFRPHACAGELRPWLYPNANMLMPFWRLRSALFPYIYAAAHNAYASGVLLVHPLYYDYPTEESTYTVSEFHGAGSPLQYAFGDDMVVCAITTNSSSLSVWLPPGRWMTPLTTSLSTYAGPQWTQFVGKALPHYPLLVRAGAVIPFRRFEDQHAVAPQQLNFLIMWSGQDNGTTTVYEDDGSTLGYQRGQISTITVNQQVLSPTTARVLITPTIGSSASPSQRVYSLHFHGFHAAPQTVTVNGQGVTWTYGISDGGSVGDDDPFAHAAGVRVPLLMAASPTVQSSSPVVFEIHLN